MEAFWVSEPQDLKNSRLCMNRGDAMPQIRLPIFSTCVKIIVTTFLVQIKCRVERACESVTKDYVTIISNAGFCCDCKAIGK
jgi:hypothetical protein